MKHLLLTLSTLALPFSAFAQTDHPDADKGAQRVEPIRKQQTSFTPYELYPWSLRSAPKLLGIYKEKYEARRLDPNDKTAEESYRSILRINMRPLIEDREAFLNYAKQDKSLSAEQRKIVEEIRKRSFPILKQKKIKELTSEELIQSINAESSTIGPLVKQFLDQMEAGKKRVAP